MWREIKTMKSEEKVIERFRRVFDPLLMDYKIDWKIRQRMEQFILEALQSQNTILKEKIEKVEGMKLKIDINEYLPKVKQWKGA